MIALHNAGCFWVQADSIPHSTHSWSRVCMAQKWNLLWVESSHTPQIYVHLAWRSQNPESRWWLGVIIYDSEESNHLCSLSDYASKINCLIPANNVFRYFVINYNGRESEKKNTHTHISEPLCCTEETQHCKINCISILKVFSLCLHSCKVI